MAKVDLIMPKMGESIMEATILKWLKQPGDTVEMDETILEIATDKVDSEIPSPVDGVLGDILFNEDDVVAVGTVIATIATDGEEIAPSPAVAEKTTDATPVETSPPVTIEKSTPVKKEVKVVAGSDMPEARPSASKRFYSPLVRNIAKSESIQMAELDAIPGTGKDGRVTKQDLLSYLGNRSSAQAPSTNGHVPSPKPAPSVSSSVSAPSVSTDGDVEIIEMDRMRKLIADHMVMSKQTSPHVTSFVEVDVTDMVKWRESVKNEFVKKHGQKITYTPIIMEAVVKAILDYPMINVSVKEKNIIRKKNINIGMATALPSGNLIVPVIHHADQKNLLGLTKSVNDLASRARGNKLKPEDIQDGTFTLTNVGTFGNVMGTPIINQPQVAIMAAGAIRKKPAVVETEYGDVIAIRHMMFLSLSYDHRVVDGFLGGSFLKRVAEYLEAFDSNTTI